MHLSEASSVPNQRLEPLKDMPQKGGCFRDSSPAETKAMMQSGSFSCQDVKSKKFITGQVALKKKKRKKKKIAVVK